MPPVFLCILCIKKTYDSQKSYSSVNEQNIGIVPRTNYLLLAKQKHLISVIFIHGFLLSSDILSVLE